MIRTYRYRVKDSSHLNWLDKKARAVNFVWNWCNDAQKHALRHNQKWPSGFDLNNLSAGAGKLLGLHSQTVQAICEKYSDSRKISRRAKLRYRGKTSLGWVPFKVSGIRLEEDAVIYAGRRLRFWNSRPIPAAAKVQTGSFSQNASGQWFLNITMRLPDETDLPASGEVGIDLGLKDMAVCTDGARIEASSFYRDAVPQLALAQRARKKRRIKKIHRRIASRRKDKNHKESTRIARSCGLIVIGDVSASKLAKTRMAKSVLDQGWSDFAGMLRYKAMGRGGIFLEVNEANTTRTCSACHARRGPKGIAGLGIRGWVCDACGTVHDRDVNAAINILRLGHEALAGGIPAV